MTGPFLPRPRALRRTAAALALAAAAVHLPARAQADAGLPPPPAPLPAPGAAGGAVPLAVGVSQKFVHESNLFRDSAGGQDDWLSSTAVELALAQPLGRGRLRGNAALQAHRHAEHDELDHTGHELDLALDWESALDLAGTVGLRASRQQYRYGLDSAAPFDGRNLEDTRAAYLQARLGGFGVWSLLAGADALERRYSQPAFAELNDLSQWSAEAGVGWRPSADLGLTLRARHTRIARDDSAQGPGDDVTRHELALAGAWQASGASRLEARLARAQERHAVLADRAFWTGGLAWDWTPGGKLLLRTELSRDTEGAAGTRLVEPPAEPLPAAGDTLRDALRWSAQWAATGKINLVLAAEHAERRLRAQVEGQPVSARDRTTAVSLGLRYSPWRSLDLACELARERRETGTAPAALTRPYALTTAGCSLAFWFR